jgi:hypothetical protein
VLPIQLLTTVVVQLVSAANPLIHTLTCLFHLAALGNCLVSWVQTYPELSAYLLLFAKDFATRCRSSYRLMSFSIPGTDSWLTVLVAYKLHGELRFPGPVEVLALCRYLVHLRERT